MKKLVTCLAFVIVLSILGQAQCNSTVTEFVEKSGYKFNTYSKCVWIISDALTIPHDGLQGSILIGEQDDFIGVGAVIKLKAHLDLSSATLAKLLRLNNELDFVKVGIDNDGDLFLRAELHKKTLDSAAFKDVFDRIKNESKKVYDATQ